MSGETPNRPFFGMTRLIARLSPFGLGRRGRSGS